MVPEETTRAADWLIRLRCPNPSAELQAEFADWLRQSPVHIETYLRSVEVWEGLALSEVDPDADIDDLVRAARDEAVPMPHMAQIAGVAPRSRRWPSWAAWAAGLAVVVLMASTFSEFQARQPVRFHTELGESRAVVLKDKSVIKLNTQTEVLVSYSGSERRVSLIHGEALFEVAKNPERPFIVSSADVVARAVGTKFSVSRTSEGSVVTVAEGRVAVTEQPDPVIAGAGKPLSVEIAAGQQAAVTSHGRGIETAKVDLDKALAWQDGRLVFEDDRLSEVAREFNRYNSTKIVIADPAVAARRISGVFRTGDPASLVTFLEMGGEIAVRRGPSGEFYVGDRKKASDRVGLTIT